MCGRYTLFTEEEIDDLAGILQNLDRSHAAGAEMKTGEIFPTNAVPVLTSAAGQMQPELQIWGFPGFQGKGVLINARAETAEQKRTFRDSLLYRRCLVPSTGFYEWSHDGRKQKYLFRLGAEAVGSKQDPRMLYMAGLFGDFAGLRRFVILTTEANASIADVHSRMPVVLTQEEQEAWLHDRKAALSLLLQTPPGLERREAAS